MSRGKTVGIAIRGWTLALLCCCVLLSAARAAYVDEVLRDGPVAYWRLGEADLNDPIVDVTGNVPNGEYDDNGNLGLEPGFPGAILNDSNTAVQIQTTFGFGCGDCGLASVPVGGVLDLGTVDSEVDITLEAWFKLLPSVDEALPPGAFPRIFHYSNGDDGQYAFGVVGNDAGPFPAQRTVWAGRGDGGDSGVVILAGPTDAIEPTLEEVWYHFVAQLDGDDVRLFLNGEELGDLTDADPIAWQATQATIGARVQADETTLVQGFPGLIDEFAIYNKLLSPERIVASIVPGTLGGASPLQAGDADEDLDFDQLDLVRVQVAAKYLTGQNATWGEGDWNGAPGGEPGNPPAGDGRFDQLDVIAALSNGFYLTGPYGAIQPSGQTGNAQTSIGYVPVPEPSALVLALLAVAAASGHTWAVQRRRSAR